MHSRVVHWRRSGERRLALHQRAACCVDLLWLGDYCACDGAVVGDADGVDFECAAVAIVTIIIYL